MQRFSNIIWLTLALAFGAPLAAQKSGKTSNQQSYTKALDIVGASMSLLDRYFVDSVDLERISRRGIDAMLSSLDPYTEYYSKEDNDQLKLITTGEYGGIGSIISQRPDSTVIINDPMEGMPAAQAGLKAGDRILEVDGQDFRKGTSDAVSKALKGKPDSKISLLIQRLGESRPRRVEFTRRKIVVNPVPYYGVTPAGYGYIKLTNFPNTAATEVRRAMTELQKTQKVKGLVLDLRDNGGGLMEEAIKIVSFFVPEGTEVLRTKARPELKQEAVYRTRSKPIALDLPLVVLIDGQSASSAEIVAGALQDVDRAVVVGQKSFGKGLIQTTMQLPHQGVLKLTTAKYYIPSGRCIQRINYKEARAGREAELPDSLTKIFHTAAGREVHDAGGILPDVKAEVDSLPTMLYYLTYNESAFDWITTYAQRHKAIAPPATFSVSDADYEAFGRMLIEKKFDYDRQSAKRLETLKEIAKLEGYLERVAPLIDSLEQALKPDLKHDLESLRPHIMRFLNTSIINRYYYRRGVIERELLSDQIVAEADRLLADQARYEAILKPKKKDEEKKELANA
ncbi:MAG: S41 family peptidase [Porphyromonadaceae bacterium]|nr:S41 family peptidase [Porphyromonadaceae bacterium]